MVSKSPKIKVLIPYFGSWPDYFESLFLPSCKRLEHVEFLFFADGPVPQYVPSNTSFVPFTLADFNALASARIGKKINLRRAYKLCDLRPFYGQIFQQFLEGYDYWGFGDIDLVFGNLERFLAEPLARGCDIISCRSLWLSGSFCLVRNQPFTNQLWLKSSSWQSVIETDDYMGFDECGGAFQELLAGQPIRQVVGRCHSMTHVARELADEGLLSVSFADCARESIRGNDYVSWDNGSVRAANGEEFGYYHMVCEKGLLAFAHPNWSTLPDYFHITPSGFYTMDELAARRSLESLRWLQGAADRVFKLPRRLRASMEREAAGRNEPLSLSYWSAFARVIRKKLAADKVN